MGINTALQEVPKTAIHNSLALGKDVSKATDKC
ncbi:rCG60322 [Rattus norvegicus]|uniref:RCG60322 n=1 Tax=Rattus norvegicus TaxID=10116 RepID=A6HT03_RAT|nr:rCG60322 [Rattus norvegicus]